MHLICQVYSVLYVCKYPLTEPLSLSRVRVLPRSGLRKVEAKGLFIDARVFRGRDWKWKDQDGKHNLHKVYTVHQYYAYYTHTGGVGSIGKVVSVMNWKNETVVSVPCAFVLLYFAFLYMCFKSDCLKLGILRLPFGGGRDSGTLYCVYMYMHHLLVDYMIVYYTSQA